MGARGGDSATAAARRGAITSLLLVAASCITPTPAQRAISLAHMHREAEGVALLKDAIAKHPEDADSRRVLVRLLGLTGDLTAAKKAAEARATCWPKSKTNDLRAFLVSAFGRADAHLFAFVYKGWNLHHQAGFELRRLRATARAGVAAQAGFGVGDD